jgi:hypothetical protein
MHQLKCQCGALRGQIDNSGISSRIRCYCSDCQAFAKFLGDDGILDAQGGTELLQMAQQHLSLTQGQEQLAIVRLSDKGLFRWYAKCCNTPIGNTLGNAKMCFIGIAHSCLDPSKMDEDFGQDIAIVNVKSAITEPKPKQKGLTGVLFRFAGILLSGRIGSKYRLSPLFNDVGKPLVQPRVLSATDRTNL